MSSQPTFFKRPADFRQWLSKHHKSETELWVGFYKTKSGKPSLTWPESVDEALCYGWIDGLRKSIDDDAYMIRFTPRKRTSIWSAVNLKRVQELIDTKRMRPAGMKVFLERDVEKSKIYSYERAQVEFDAAMIKQFRAHRTAWDFFQAQPPSYRKPATNWVISAKQEATRQRRLATLIAESAAGQRIPQLRRDKKQ